MHAHLRNDIPRYTLLAKQCGISLVLYMADFDPPLGTEQDVLAVREGLADGTIDVIASDFAPAPRKTGIAGFRSFIPLSDGLCLDGTLSAHQLKEKLFSNPRKILWKAGFTSII